MCKMMEDMRNEAAREAEKMKAIRMARLMIEDGKLNYEDIAMYTELTLEEVEKIALEKDYLKASHRYEKKLEGKDLRNKIIDTLLKKGYNYEDIKNILEVKENNDE